MTKLFPVAVLALLAVALAACIAGGSQSPEPTEPCLANSLGEGTISGDPATPDRVTFTRRGDGQIYTLVQPLHVRFVFDPALRVVDADSGATIARQGDLVEAGGTEAVNADQNVYSVCYITLAR